eukprot:GILK01001821.1.p1 GENE.GILK01001821.1~~GILK01001821.1.p1  ORF type:complete len:642 (+),score=108.43 GILK01001821.1:49-1974(+)
MSSSSSAAVSDKQGYLSVRRKIFWASRYAILEGKVLFYFKHAKDITPRAIIMLEGCQIQDAGMDGNKHSFTIRNPLRQNAGVFYLGLDTAKEAQEWMQALRHAAGLVEAPLPSSEMSTQKERTPQSPSRRPDADAGALQTASWPVAAVDNGMRVFLPPSSVVHGLSSSDGFTKLILQLHAISSSVGSESNVALLYVLLLAPMLLLPALLVLLRVPINPVVSILLGAVMAWQLFKRTPKFIRQFKVSAAVSSPPDLVVNVLKDVDRRREWDVLLKDARVVEKKDANNTILALTYADSSLGSDCSGEVEFIVSQSVWTTEDGETVIREVSTTHPACPAQSNRTRHRIEWSAYTVRPLEPLQTGGFLGSIVTFTSKSEVQGWNAVHRNASHPRSPMTVAGLRDFLLQNPNIDLSNSADALLTMDESSDQEESSAPISAADKMRESYLKTAETSLKELVRLASETEKDGWKVLQEKEGVKIWRKEVANNPANTIRGAGTIKAPVAKVLALIGDMAKKPLYDPMFEKGHVVEQIAEGVKVVYQAFKPVWPTSARDFCNVTYEKHNEDGSCVLAARSVTHVNCPEVKDAVRADIQVGGFIMKPLSANECELIFLTQVDLCGRIPRSVVNSVSTKQPMCIAGIRKLVE